MVRTQERHASEVIEEAAPAVGEPPAFGEESLPERLRLLEGHVAHVPHLGDHVVAGLNDGGHGNVAEDGRAPVREAHVAVEALATEALDGARVLAREPDGLLNAARVGERGELDAGAAGIGQAAQVVVEAPVEVDILRALAADVVEQALAAVVEPVARTGDDLFHAYLGEHTGIKA